MDTFYKRVFILPLSGYINSTLANHVQRSLDYSSIYSPIALLVTIDSKGGSLVQAKIITNMLKNYCRSKTLPLICMAQDRVLGSALIILTSGFKVLANQFSQFGQIGHTNSPAKQYKLFEKLGIESKYITAGQKKISFNPMSPLTQQETRQNQRILDRMEEELRFQLRQGTRPGWGQSNGIFNSEQALRAGLIDGIESQQQVLQRCRVEHKALEDRKYLLSMINYI